MSYQDQLQQLCTLVQDFHAQGHPPEVVERVTNAIEEMTAAITDMMSLANFICPEDTCGAVYSLTVSRDSPIYVYCHACHAINPKIM